MRKNWIILIVGVFLFIGNLQSQIVKYEYEITPSSSFDKVAVDGITKVMLQKSDDAVVLITSSDSIMPDLGVKVVKGVLKVNSIEDVSDIIIKYVNLTEIKANGASKVSTVDAIVEDKLKIEANGASKVAVEVEVDELHTSLNGISVIKVRGKADDHYVKGNGATKLRAYDLKTDVSVLDLNGMASAYVYATDKVQGNAGGASSIKYKGNPDAIEIQANEGANVGKQTGSKDTTRVKIGGSELIIVDKDLDKIEKINPLEGNGDADHIHKKKKSKFKGHWEGLELGTYMFADANQSFENVFPAEYDFLKPISPYSFKIGMNLFQTNVNLIRQKLGLLTGLGMDFSKLYFDHNKKIIANDSIGISFVPSGINKEDVKRNSLYTNYLTVPVILELQTNSKDKTNSFHLGAGVIGGLRLWSNSKMVYTEDDSKRKIKVKDDFYLNPLKLDLTARAGWYKFNFYANYALLPMFKEGYGPEIYPVTVGMTIIPF